MAEQVANKNPVIAQRKLSGGLVIVGGGLSGVSAALAAARHGAKVVLIQDRPMLGGNASSEIRMGVCGATGENCKETGIIEELQLANYHYNPLLRYTLWDDVLYWAVVNETNITLLLNTSVQEVQMSGSVITSVKAWNINEYCYYTVSGKIFADCSGDSILRLSGAEFCVGRESCNDHNESYAPASTDNLTMGNSMLMQLRRHATHRPFHPPTGAHHFDADTIPKNRRLEPEENNYWWLEYGGIHDCVADAGSIQLELKKIVYGVWEYLKNHPSGMASCWELDWLCSLPGKRESARYLGDYLLTQNDIVKQTVFPDSIGHGGWPVDDHDPKGFYGDIPSAIQFGTPSPYSIPYRVLYSKNIDNLYFAGRNISATHIAMSSTRVMATCSVLGQAVGTAATLALKNQLSPRQVGEKCLTELQQQLLEDDQFIPGVQRKIPHLTEVAFASHPVLRDSFDRDWQGQDHGAWLAPGEYAQYSWPEPVTISKVRIVFDTELTFKGKRQHKHEGIDFFVEMPGFMAKAFRVEALLDNGWQTILQENENFRRLYRFQFEATTATAVRLLVDSCYGEEKAHVFSFEVLN